MEDKNITKAEMKEVLEESYREIKRRKAGNIAAIFSIILGIVFVIFIPALIPFGFLIGVFGFLISLFNKNFKGLILNLLGMFINGGFILLLV